MNRQDRPSRKEKSRLVLLLRLRLQNSPLPTVPTKMEKDLQLLMVRKSSSVGINHAPSQINKDPCKGAVRSVWVSGRCELAVAMSPQFSEPPKPGISPPFPDLSRPASSLFHCLLLNCALGGSHFITKAAYQSTLLKKIYLVWREIISLPQGQKRLQSVMV